MPLEAFQPTALSFGGVDELWSWTYPFHWRFRSYSRASNWERHSTFREGLAAFVQRARIEEATDAKAILDGLPCDSEIVAVEIAAIPAACNIDFQTRRCWGVIFRNRSDRLIDLAVLAVAVNFSSQVAGADAITYYATEIAPQDLRVHFADIGPAVSILHSPFGSNSILFRFN